MESYYYIKNARMDYEYLLKNFQAILLYSLVGIMILSTFPDMMMNNY